MKITKPKVITLILVCASVFLIGQSTPVKDTRTGSPTYGKWLYNGKAYVNKLQPPWGGSGGVGGWFTRETGQPIQRQRPVTLEERVVILERTVRNLQNELAVNNRAVNNLSNNLSGLKGRVQGIQWNNERQR